MSALKLKYRGGLGVGRRFVTFLFLIFLGTIVSTLGSISLPIGFGEGLTSFWPGMVVQVLGSIWFGLWGVAAGVIFPIFSGAIVGSDLLGLVGFIPANLAQCLIPYIIYRHYRLELPPKTFRDYLFFILGGIILPASAGALLGGLAIGLARFQGVYDLHLTHLMIRWLLGCAIPVLLFGLPLLVMLSPVFLQNRDYWENKPVDREEDEKNLADLSLLEKILLAFSLGGIFPMGIIVWIFIDDYLKYINHMAQVSGQTLAEMLSTDNFTSALVMNIAIFLTLILAAYLARLLSSPLKQIADLSCEVGEGNLDIEMPVNSKDEIGQFSRSFNRMIYNLRKSKQKEQQLTIASVTLTARALEARDPYTQGHSERVAAYAAEIAKEMELSPQEVDDIALAGKLHDIGKIGISDKVLLKPGKLDQDEYEQIKAHPKKSVEILTPLAFLAPTFKMIYFHHERYDGKGYPKGLKGENIPLGARILAVADTYDALTSTRPYRHACSMDEAVKILLEVKGTQLDSACVDAFLKVLDKQKTGEFLLRF